MSSGLSLVLQADSTSFRLRDFTESFTREPGLKRSVDKIFEIVVYALFSTLLEVLDVRIEVHIDNINTTILKEFRISRKRFSDYLKKHRRGIRKRKFIGQVLPMQQTEDLICGRTLGSLSR